MSITAADILRHEIHEAAERSYQRGQYPASVHNVYIAAYIEARLEARTEQADRDVQGE